MGGRPGTAAEAWCGRLNQPTHSKPFDVTELTAQDVMLSHWLVAQSADAVVFADRQGRIAVWNAAAERLFGFSANEALGERLDIIIPENLRAAHWRGFDTAIATGRTKHSGKPAATRAVHADGRRLYVEMSFAVIHDGDGAVVGALAQARDITEPFEKQRAERARNRPAATLGGHA